MFIKDSTFIELLVAVSIVVMTAVIAFVGISGCCVEATTPPRPASLTPSSHLESEAVTARHEVEEAQEWAKYRQVMKNKALTQFVQFELQEWAKDRGLKLGNTVCAWPSTEDEDYEICSVHTTVGQTYRVACYDLGTVIKGCRQISTEK